MIFLRPAEQLRKMQAKIGCKAGASQNSVNSYIHEHVRLNDHGGFSKPIKGSKALF
jgi:hypothetical protein